MKFISAYKMNDPDADRVVAIRYRDDQDRSCTMFVQVGNEQAVDVLVKLINENGEK
jgi:hypothetical protein